MSKPPSNRLAAWMVEFGPALRRYFARRVGLANADDLVQDVFMRLHATDADAEDGDVRRQLFYVAKSVLLNRLRSEHRHLADLHGTIDEAAGLTDDLSPERILSAKQEYARVLVTILDLPPRMRTALVLHRFGKLSLSAIAKRMGVQKSTVQVLVQRAMARVTLEMEKKQ